MADRFVLITVKIATWGGYCEDDFAQCPWLDHVESACHLHGGLERDRSAAGRKRWARHADCLALDAEGVTSPECVKEKNRSDQ